MGLLLFSYLASKSANTVAGLLARPIITSEAHNGTTAHGLYATPLLLTYPVCVAGADRLLLNLLMFFSALYMFFCCFVQTRGPFG